MPGESGMIFLAGSVLKLYITIAGMYHFCRGHKKILVSINDRSVIYKIAIKKESLAAWFKEIEHPDYAAYWALKTASTRKGHFFIGKNTNLNRFYRNLAEDCK